MERPGRWEFRLPPISEQEIAGWGDQPKTQQAQLLTGLTFKCISRAEMATACSLEDLLGLGSSLVGESLCKLQDREWRQPQFRAVTRRRAVCQAEPHAVG